MKVGTRNAMVISVASVALVVDNRRAVGLLRARIGGADDRARDRSRALDRRAVDWETAQVVEPDDRATFAAMVADAGAPDRRSPLDGRVPAARHRGVRPSRARTGAVDDDRDVPAHGQRDRPRRRRRLARREPALRVARAARPARREERVRARRVRLVLGARRRRVGAARAWCSRRRWTTHEVTTVEGRRRRRRALRRAARRSCRPARCSAASARPVW